MFNPNASGVGAEAKRRPRTPLALRLNISFIAASDISLDEPERVSRKEEVFGERGIVGHDRHEQLRRSLRAIAERRTARRRAQVRPVVLRNGRGLSPHHARCERRNAEGEDAEDRGGERETSHHGRT